ncbi:hypothetical protein [Variovorax sp. DT-64]|uniref:hypothetical protein n=1 Tax=Variovorax sp. DT-64 TaxID=3396160 RepID=UPI003F540B6C
MISVLSKPSTKIVDIAATLPNSRRYLACVLEFIRASSFLPGCWSTIRLCSSCLQGFFPVRYLGIH